MNNASCQYNEGVEHRKKNDDPKDTILCKLRRCLFLMIMNQLQMFHPNIYLVKYNNKIKLHKNIQNSRKFQILLIIYLLHHEHIIYRYIHVLVQGIFIHLCIIGLISSCII